MFTPTTRRSEHHEPAFRHFDSSVERILGADMRLVYGIFAPAGLVIGLIVLLAFKLAAWLLVAIVVVEVAALGLVLVGLLEMMSSAGDDPS